MQPGRREMEGSVPGSASDFVGQEIIDDQVCLAASLVIRRRLLSPAC